MSLRASGTQFARTDALDAEAYDSATRVRGGHSPDRPVAVSDGVEVAAHGAYSSLFDVVARTTGQQLKSLSRTDLAEIIQNLTDRNLENDPNFRSLAPAVQERMLAGIKSGSASLAEAYKRLASSPTFRDLSPEVQGKTVDLLAKVSNDNPDARLIERLVRSPSFRQLNENEQKDLLDGLSNTKEARDGLRAVMDSPLFPGANIPFVGNPIQVQALRQVARAVAPIETGFGKEVDAIVNKSLTLSRHFREIIKDGWSVSFGPDGKGSFANSRTKEIVLDGSLAKNPALVAQLLAHEVGHAKKPNPPSIPASGLTREEYINRNVELKVRGEAEACFENLQARQEILDNGGSDIGINGARGEAYRRIFESFRAGTISREEAIGQIAQIWGPNEITSTTGQTYNDYYDDEFENFWDANYSHIPPGGRAE